MSDGADVFVHHAGTIETTNAMKTVLDHMGHQLADLKSDFTRLFVDQHGKTATDCRNLLAQFETAFDDLVGRVLGLTQTIANVADATRDLDEYLARHSGN
jgi:hypothetical protein